MLPPLPHRTWPAFLPLLSTLTGAASSVLCGCFLVSFFLVLYPPSCFLWCKKKYWYKLGTSSVFYLFIFFKTPNNLKYVWLFMKIVITQVPLCIWSLKGCNAPGGKKQFSSSVTLRIIMFAFRYHRIHTEMCDGRRLIALGVRKRVQQHKRPKR